MSGRKLISLPLAFLVAMLASGCGGTSSPSVRGPDFGSEEGQKIARFVSDFDEARADAKKFKNSFAEKAPANWKAYSAYVYEVQGKPTVTGDTATATITIKADANQSDTFTREWTFVKAGAEWKLKDAPLK